MVGRHAAHRNPGQPAATWRTQQPVRHCAPMKLADILFSQGFGSRRECAALLRNGAVAVGGQTLVDGTAQVQVELQEAGFVFHVNGQPWPYHAKALLMLHKPPGYECSRSPRDHLGVLSLLPAPLRERGVQPVGRLDQNTTGLLLLTDDGTLIHRLTSPKHHVAKVYEVTTKHPVAADLPALLVAGVMLHDDVKPVAAAACEITGEFGLRLTLTDGRYHQVKRMVAAVGNRVEGLHRSAFGGLVLDETLKAGEWRWLDSADAIFSKG